MAIKQPYLIQRCTLLPGNLKYDYMGSSEFEMGDQAKSIKRIMAKGVHRGEVNVLKGGIVVPVYMLAAMGFSWAKYQPWLQKLADADIRLKESAWFNYAVERKLGMPEAVFRSVTMRINLWFDFQNDVFWTLSRGDIGYLQFELEGIVWKWAEKNKAR